MRISSPKQTSAPQAPGTKPQGTVVPPKASELRNHAAYKRLSPGGRIKADEIMARALEGSRPGYYLGKLKLLLDTPTTAKKGGSTSDMNWHRVSLSQASRQALNDALGDTSDAYAGLEEYRTNSRQWTQRAAWRGKTVRVDRTNRKDLAVKIKVRLIGDTNIVSQIRHMEDAIEKHLSIPGFVVNLEFTGKSGLDIFDVKVDANAWTTAANWVGAATSLGHELMHLLGLPDEYDYIEGHAGNKHMAMETRLHWFLVEMKRQPAPPDSKDGIMRVSKKKPLWRHALAAVGLPPDVKVAVSLRG
jgi:hypothetical protein